MTPNRPLVFLDLEATSTDPEQARIFQVSILRVDPSGEETAYDQLFDPWEEIPDHIEELTGITTDQVTGKPSFSEKASAIAALVGGSDVCGHNIKEYDLPLLKKELRRSGNEMPEIETVLDTLQVHREFRSASLEFLAEVYLGLDTEDMHDASKDIEVTKALLEKQHELFELSDTPEDIVEEDLTTYLDDGEKFELRDDDTVVFWFGKHYGETLEEVIDMDYDYIDWMLSPSQYEDLGSHIDPYIE